MICDTTSTFCWYVGDGKDLNLPICSQLETWSHKNNAMTTRIWLSCASGAELESWTPGLLFSWHGSAKTLPSHVLNNLHQKKPQQIKNPYKTKKPYTPQTKPKQNQSKAKKTKANQSKPNNSHQDQIKNLKHFYFSVGSITGNSNNLPFPLHQYVVKEKQQRRAAAGEN